MASLGQKLAEARNRKGISIREASDSTKIRGDYLTKFENDDFEVNLPPVYLRGFLTNYARYLDLDPEGILADFDALQPADKRRPRKALGTISAGSPIDEGPPEDSPSPPQSQLDTNVVFPWLKVSMALGSILVATIITILIARQCSDEDPQTPGSGGSSVDEPGIGGETPALLDAEQPLVLKLIATGPIQLLYVKPELDGQTAQTFRNLKKGDERKLNFWKTVDGAASSIENLKLEIDGKQFGFQLTGPQNFHWPLESPKED